MVPITAPPGPFGGPPKIGCRGDALCVRSGREPSRATWVLGVVDGGGVHDGPTSGRHGHPANLRAMSRPESSPEDIGPLLVTPAEAARMLRVARSTLYTLLAERQIPSCKIGNLRRVRVEDLQRWIDRLMAADAETAPPRAHRAPPKAS